MSPWTVHSCLWRWSLIFFSGDYLMVLQRFFFFLVFIFSYALPNSAPLFFFSGGAPQFLTSPPLTVFFCFCAAVFVFGPPRESSHCVMTIAFFLISFPLPYKRLSFLFSQPSLSIGPFSEHSYFCLATAFKRNVRSPLPLSDFPRRQIPPLLDLIIRSCSFATRFLLTFVLIPYASPFYVLPSFLPSPFSPLLIPFFIEGF